MRPTRRGEPRSFRLSRVSTVVERSGPLPEPLPADPLPLIQQWLTDAGTRVRNPTAMALATVDDDGRPTARMILCRGFDAGAGWFVFYTDRESVKGHHLTVRPRAACVFYWEAFDRQIRVEGPVTLAPDADVEAYWVTRPPDARVAAIATRQSRPIASRAALVAQGERTTRELDGLTPRPERWVGYRVWAERVELWISQPARVHDRARWTRTLTRSGDGFAGGAWSATRLEP
jgi:pyridoxamine 5'-phosphate oxidase